MIATAGLALGAAAVVLENVQHSLRVDNIVTARVSPLQDATIMYASLALKIHTVIDFQRLHYVNRERASNVKPMKTVLLLPQLNAQAILVFHAQRMANVPI